MRYFSANGTAAEIYVDGELYTTISLDKTCEITVSTEYGSNTIEVKDGYISVVAADCPDKVCVHSGAINTTAVPIICLPHRLEIKVISQEPVDIDGQTR